MGKGEGGLNTSVDLIKEAIKDLYITPREAVRKWSEITKQTCQIRFAYPGQHLASLITGFKGSGTAARGDDLEDGTEVKTCSRADQLGECKDCEAGVLVNEKVCSRCESSNIKRKTDSHWIFPITSKSELNLLLNKIPRIIMILFDQEDESIEDIRLRAWTIDPKENYVRDFFSDYYYHNYRKKDKPAPCNLHPLKYDFYKMIPKLIFHAEIKNQDIQIKFWDLKNPKVEAMPISLLSKDWVIKYLSSEIKKKGLDTHKISKDQLKKVFPTVPPDIVRKLPMKLKVLKTYKKKYVRRG